jgi:hypothetical protein
MQQQNLQKEITPQVQLNRYQKEEPVVLIYQLNL